jgi:hypothetical protein
MAKGKKLGKGLAALIRPDSDKTPKNMRNEEEEEHTPSSANKEVAPLKEEPKKGEPAPKEEPKARDEPRAQRPPRVSQFEAVKKRSDKRSAYDQRLAKYWMRKEERYKRKAQDLDQSIEAWPEEEYMSPISFNYFSRNKEGKPRERYVKLLSKHKKR